MSWQSYVDDHLMCEIDGNHLTSAAIIGHDGAVWAQSANFPQVFFISFKLFPFLVCDLSLCSTEVQKTGCSVVLGGKRNRSVKINVSVVY